MKKPLVATPYGTLQVSAKRFGNIVRLMVGGAIETPDRHPLVLGQSIWLNYELGPSGWFHVDILGRPWVETPAMTVAATTREIEAVVVEWLREHRAEVREYILATFNADLTRLRRRLGKVVAAAEAQLQAEEAFLERIAAAG